MSCTGLTSRAFGGLFLSAVMGCTQGQESKIIPPPAASFPSNARELLRPGGAGGAPPKKSPAKAPATKPDDSKKDDGKKDEPKKDDKPGKS
jgi:hypothetical protein